MKHGQKPADSEMEDVLASIRRAIDENAYGPTESRPAESLAEFKSKFATPANQETRNRRSPEPASPAQPAQPQGFAGILSGKKSYGEPAPPREAFKPREPVQRQPEPAAPHTRNERRNSYHGYHAAELEEKAEPAPQPYQSPPATAAGRYLPPAPAAGAHRQVPAQREGLVSDASSEAIQAAFTRLAETVTRRVPGERPPADATQEMLRGMLKQWLDDNLPKMVERLVREEIERVVRRPR